MIGLSFHCFYFRWGNNVSLISLSYGKLFQARRPKFPDFLVFSAQSAMNFARGDLLPIIVPAETGIPFDKRVVSSTSHTAALSFAP